MVANSEHFHLSMATEAELLNELARRHDDAPFLFTRLDYKTKSVTFVETFDNGLAPKELLNSLSYALTMAEEVIKPF